MTVKEDMTGWKMWEHGIPDSRLTVIQRTDDYIVPSTGKKVARWICECSCENHTRLVVYGNNLRRGNPKSCGCLQKERAFEKNFKGNKYELREGYGVLWETNTNQEVLFDISDAEKILQHTWLGDDWGYTVTSINGKRVRMHVFLGYKGCDHKDRNTKNNTSENLRPCSNRENSRNRNKRSGCSSQYIGITFDRDRKRWRAYINTENGHKRLGDYLTEAEALIARLKAEKEHFGEFAPQRHLFEEHNI